MKKSIRIAVLLGLIAGMTLFGVPAFAAGQGNAQDFASDHILVMFNDGTPENTKQDVHNRQNGAVIGKIDKLGVQVVKIPAGKVKEKVNAYRSEKAVAFAEPDYLAYALGTPNDPNYLIQWGLTKIQAPQAWDVTTGAPAVKIAILDTGVDQNHEDLAGKVVLNKNFTTSSTVDDRYGHGTHVAGIAAAVTNNSKGVAGVGYNCTIMNGKVLDDSGSGAYSWIANGIIWAADNGANVINMSLGGGSGDSTLQRAVDYAWSKGVVVVAAAGNNGVSSPSYPAYYSNCIAVAATDSSDAKASWSNYGSWVDVAAPGAGIYSTIPNHSNKTGMLNYGYLSGTSMATPFVAGEAALIWATSYGTTNTNVRNRIESTADRITGTGTDWTYGRINALSAVTSAAPAPDFLLSASPVSQSAVQGSQATYTVTVTPSGGFNGTAGFSVSGLPSGATGTFNPASVTATGTSTLTVTTINSTPTGTYALTITGTSGTLTHTTAVTLVVTSAAPTPDFSLSASPTSQTVVRGMSAAYTVTVTPSGGFNGTVGFSVSGLPSGATGTFNPASVTASGTSILTVTTINSTPTKTYTLTIKGTSGGSTKTAAVTLVVRKR
jgi:thermitase